MDAREAKKRARDQREPGRAGARPPRPNLATVTEARAQVDIAIEMASAAGAFETTYRIERVDVAGQSPTGPTPQQLAALLRQSLEADGYEVAVSPGGDVVHVRISWGHAPDTSSGNGGGGGGGKDTGKDKGGKARPGNPTV